MHTLLVRTAIVKVPVNLKGMDFHSLNTLLPGNASYSSLFSALNCSINSLVAASCVQMYEYSCVFHSQTGAPSMCVTSSEVLLQSEIAVAPVIVRLKPTNYEVLGSYSEEL
jgi:hypothetical protein